MSAFLDRLRRGGLIGDGAMGSMLLAAGLPAGSPPERWNHERPEAVAAVHRAYRAAGAAVLQTNSFGGTRPRLAPSGLEGQVEAINRDAVRLARSAAGGDAFVAGTIGPTALRRAPRERLREIFTAPIGVLVEEGVDLLLIETMCDPEEAVVVVEAARRLTALPVLVTFTFDREGRAPSGARPEEAAAAVLEAGADGVGANCGEGPESLLPPVAAMRAAFPEVPLLAQPSAGLPVAGPRGPRYPLDPAAWAAWAARFTALAHWVGGCCGTTPEHIAALVEVARD